MPFEDLDKKIRDAADQHHPAYDEKAWDKMEKLLNQYLPQGKKDRRRIIFWLFLFLLAGGGTAYFLNSKSRATPDTVASKIENAIQPSEKLSAEKNTAPQTQTSKKDNETGLNEKTSVAAADKRQTDNNNTSYLPLDENNKRNQNISKPQQLLLTKIKKNKNAEPGRVNSVEKFHKPDAEKNKLADVISNADQKQKINAAPFQNLNTVINTPVSDTTQRVELKKPAENAVAASNNETKEKQIAELKKEKTKKKSKNKFADGIFILIAAGPDVSAVRLDNMGKLKPVYGAGIGYSFSKRFSVQTGLYSSRKIYSAGPEDYHPPAGWWTYYPNLQKVDADCRVLEIPLLLTHSFSSAKTKRKGSWFVSYGLSSYLMKKENYTYHYKTYAGQYRTSNWSTSNQNKHLFSVINLSGGYQHSITKNISVSAMPYLKLPWQGVGFGKIKLNSGGILLNVTANLFKK